MYEEWMKHPRTSVETTITIYKNSIYNLSIQIYVATPLMLTLIVVEK